MSGYACAITGIISTRTIDSWKERLITILILPLISCAARLPVYVLMIVAFIPQIYIFNFIGLQGFVMVIMYFIGTITAFILAKVFSKFLSSVACTPPTNCLICESLALIFSEIIVPPGSLVVIKGILFFCWVWPGDALPPRITIRDRLPKTPFVFTTGTSRV